ncbi:Glycogen synthase, partial [Dissostichus eleginoides]
RLVLPGPDYESGGRKRRCRLEGTGELTEQLPRIKSAHDSELIFNPKQTQFSSRFTYDYLMFNHFRATELDRPISDPPPWREGGTS